MIYMNHVITVWSWWGGREAGAGGAGGGGGEGDQGGSGRPHGQGQGESGHHQREVQDCEGSTK